MIYLLTPNCHPERDEEREVDDGWVIFTQHAASLLFLKLLKELK